jgi:hypothetical protein
LNTPQCISMEINAMRDWFLLSLAQLSSCRYKFLGSGTGPIGQFSATVDKMSMHLDFPLRSASNNEFVGGMWKYVSRNTYWLLLQTTK